jgi:hypothetical protein
VVVLLALVTLASTEVQLPTAPRASPGAAPSRTGSSSGAPRGSTARAPSAKAPVPLAFGEIFAPGPDLVLSEKARSLRGRRVRMEGYAAELEDAPAGAFWLVPLPVRGDESGAGVGDLPPDSVLVMVRSAGDRPIRPAAPGLISVSGVLEAGHADGADGAGQSSLLRIVLDRAPARSPAKPAKAARNARTPAAPAVPATVPRAVPALVP